MKQNVWKKMAAVSIAATMLVGTVTGCGSASSNESADAQTSTAESESAETADTSGGTILWMSNLSSGAAYDAEVAYGEAIAGAMGYDLKVVYGDGYNDPDGNLTAVKNGMTSDVVGIILSQDGGVQAIMEEYPNLPVIGYNTDMNSVFSDDPDIASNASVMDSENWLGTIADGHIDGVDMAEQYFAYVQEQGWEKIGVLTFPGYAYPSFEVASTTMEELCEEAGIEIVGGVVTMEFTTLDESYFQEEGRDDLDGIVGFCAGTSFVYPTMVQAKADGLCAEKTKLASSGFDNDASLIADIGEEGTISYLSFSPCENIGYVIALLDRAITGTMYDDFTVERIDSLEYVIDSKEDIDNVMSKSLIGTLSVDDAQISYEDIQSCESYQELKDLFQSEQLTVDALAE